MSSMPKLKEADDFRPYSPSEQRLFELLPVNRKGISIDEMQTISTKDIAKKYFRRMDKPMYGQNTVTGLLRSLARKVEWNKEPFRVMRSKRRGPLNIEYWIER